MKRQHDLVRGHLRKAESDLANLDMCIKNNCALDTDCFHAQQAAERALKAVLVHKEVQPPNTHNLMQLVSLASNLDAAFKTLRDDAALLTPFAVETRYDQDFWPTLDDAIEARQATIRIITFCQEHLNQ